MLLLFALFFLTPMYVMLTTSLKDMAQIREGNLLSLPNLAQHRRLGQGLVDRLLAFAGDGLPGTVSMLEPTGPETYALVDTPVGMLTARVPGKVHQHVGEQVHLRWSAGDAHLFDAQTERRVA